MDSSKKTDTLKSMLELYRLDVTQNGKPKSYERLLDMLQRYQLNRRRRINRDEYTQGGRSRSASPGFVGDKGSKGKGKGKGKKESKGKTEAHPENKVTDASGAAKVLVVEKAPALTNMIPKNAVVRLKEKEKGKAKREEETHRPWLSWTLKFTRRSP